MKNHVNTVAILVSGLLFMAGLTSCEFEELTAPVRIDVEVSLAEDEAPLSYLSFERIMLNIGQISFYGIRQEGNDVLFSTRPGDTFGMHLLTYGQNTSPVTYFDIPQGAYQLMRWDIETESIDDDVFPDDYIDSDDSGFIIEGTYSQQDGAVVKLFIAIDEEELIRIESESASGEVPIPILSGNVYTVKMEINPQAIMKGIPRTLIEQAETEEEDDIEFIEISEDENEELYDLVLFQLSKTLKAVVR